VRLNPLPSKFKAGAESPSEISAVFRYRRRVVAAPANVTSVGAASARDCRSGRRGADWATPRPVAMGPNSRAYIYRRIRRGGSVIFTLCLRKYDSIAESRGDLLASSPHWKLGLHAKDRGKQILVLARRHSRRRSKSRPHLADLDMVI